MTPREKEHQLLAVCDTWKGDSPLETVLVLFEVKFSSVHKRHVIRGVAILTDKLYGGHRKTTQYRSQLI